MKLFRGFIGVGGLAAKREEAERERDASGADGWHPHIPDVVAHFHDNLHIITHQTVYKYFPKVNIFLYEKQH